MKGRWLIVFFLFVTGSANSQNLSRKQADLLIATTRSSKTVDLNTVSLIKLSLFFVNKEGSLRLDLDSAGYYLQLAKQITKGNNNAHIQGYLSFAEAWYSDEKREKAQTIQFAEQAISLLKRTGDNDLLGQAYSELGRQYSDYTNDKQTAKRTALVDSAVNCLQHSSNKLELAKQLQMLGDLYNDLGDIPKSLGILRRALDVYRSIQYRQLQGVYVLISANYTYLTSYKEALQYGLLALKACQSVKDSTAQLTEIENNIGSIYRYLGDQDEAIKHYSGALYNAERSNDSSGVYILTHNLSRSYVEDHQPVKALALLNNILKKYPGKKRILSEIDFDRQYMQAYMAMGNFKDANVYFNKCKTLLKDPQMQFVDGGETIYFSLAQYLEMNHQFLDALYYNKLSISSSQKTGDTYELLQGYKLQYEIDSALKNYKSAFLNATRFKALNDSIFTQNKNKQIQELQISYETKEKDNAIVLLNQKSKLQQDEIGSAVRVRDETIVGIGILLILGGVFTRQYRIRQKAFKIIEKQNDLIIASSDEIVSKNEVLEGLVKEKEYLVLEIHHRVKNNLQTTMSLLNMQSASISDKIALNAIKDSQRRMHAMSLIHHRLYQSDSLGLINMEIYIGELLVYLAESFGNTKNVILQKVLQDVNLDVAIALPLGLIINEAITNAFKYAFPGVRKGTIIVSIEKISNETIILRIEDDGIGFQTKDEDIKLNSLGLKLMNGLTEQINGTINLVSDRGTKISILFRDAVI